LHFGRFFYYGFQGLFKVLLLMHFLVGWFFRQKFVFFLILLSCWILNDCSNLLRQFYSLSMSLFTNPQNHHIMMACAIFAKKNSLDSMSFLQPRKCKYKTIRYCVHRRHVIYAKLLFIIWNCTFPAFLSLPYAGEDMILISIHIFFKKKTIHL
jgi:hypothetical protein